MAVAGAGIAYAAVGSVAGHTHFVVDAADLAALRELRAAATARIAEIGQEPGDAETRQLLADAEVELAVLDEAIEEIAAVVDHAGQPGAP